MISHRTIFGGDHCGQSLCPVLREGAKTTTTCAAITAIACLWISFHREFIFDLPDCNYAKTTFVCVVSLALSLWGGSKFLPGFQAHQ
jgi:hypothetical protein